MFNADLIICSLSHVCHYVLHCYLRWLITSPRTWHWWQTYWRFVVLGEGWRNIQFPGSVERPDGSTHKEAFCAICFWCCRFTCDMQSSDFLSNSSLIKKERERERKKWRKSLIFDKVISKTSQPQDECDALTNFGDKTQSRHSEFKSSCANCFHPCRH